MTPLFFLLACSGVEPLELPTDPAARGVPVGVRTYEYDGEFLEVWYPAPDATAEEEPEAVDLGAWLPTSFTDAVGAVDVPPLEPGAVRDAPVRDAGEPFPAIFFSHGFGGFRTQSVDYTVHLASRGYVVIAADHPGRMLGDVLPCLFDPPLEGCDLTGFTEDPAIEDLEAALAWMEDAAAEGGDFAAMIDTETLGLTGHSAGGNTTASLGDDDERFDALLPMAMSAGPSRDVPALLMDGSCDGFVPTESVDAAAEGLLDGQRVRVLGAGHLAFSDICQLDLAGLAEEVLADRDDLNVFYYDSLLSLGTDGCPGAEPIVDRPECTDSFLDLETSAEIIRYYGAAFFDAELKGTGAVEGGVFEAAELE